MVDFSRAGAENASLTPSKRPICSCMVETLLVGKTVHADTDDDPIRTAARQIDRDVVMMLLSRARREMNWEVGVSICADRWLYFVRGWCQQTCKSDCCWMSEKQRRSKRCNASKMHARSEWRELVLWQQRWSWGVEVRVADWLNCKVSPI